MLEDNELSAEDLAIIQAFDAITHWEDAPSTERAASPITPLHESEHTEDTTTDMLLIFVAEVAEDIATMQRALRQLEQHNTMEPARFLSLRRCGHKIRGAAGAMNCTVMATLAQRIEEIAQQVIQQRLLPMMGSSILVQAVLALEETLTSFADSGEENPIPLLGLEEEIQRLGLKLQQDDDALALSSMQHEQVPDETTDASSIRVETSEPGLGDTQPLVILSAGTSVVRVDAQRIEQLEQHSEQLTALCTPLGSTQAQVEHALQDLQKAEQRLHLIENELATSHHTQKPSAIMHDEHPTSSLIARILHEAAQRNDMLYIRRIKPRLRLLKNEEPQHWDELNMERYTERDQLMRALSEAVADVSLATTAVNAAYTQLRNVLKQSLEQTTIVRNDTFLLRSAPLRVLLPYVQRAIAMSAVILEQDIHFEVTGEATEIDQDILEVLCAPLLQFIRTCITNSFTAQEIEKETATPERYRVWLRAQGSGNEVTLELGFSMPIQGDVLDTMQHIIQRLNGTITLRRNSMGGVSFHLRLPRAHGTVRCLLVRSRDQHLLVSFSQIQRIEDGRQATYDILYTLAELLGFASEPTPLQQKYPIAIKGVAAIQPVLILPQSGSRLVMGILVDDVVDELEVTVKPLMSYMQRPGIGSAAIDGKGNVLLLLDLPELLRHHSMVQRTRSSDTQRGIFTQTKIGQEQQGQRHPSILITDDSTSIRQSLHSMLRETNYTIYEASDGMEALEQAIEHPPNILLLDMEMPNLNGYDLLNTMHLYPELANVKTIVLTSRSSDKHRQRVLAMGAQVYLTKPCSQETLLAAIRGLLA